MRAWQAGPISPLGALGRKGAPGLEVKLLGEMYRQQPDGLQQRRCAATVIFPGRRAEILKYHCVPDTIDPCGPKGK